MEKLFNWAQEAEQPLRIYATGLLAGAMENQDIAANYREENSVLVRRGLFTSNRNQIRWNDVSYTLYSVGNYSHPLVYMSLPRLSIANPLHPPLCFTQLLYAPSVCGILFSFRNLCIIYSS